MIPLDRLNQLLEIDADAGVLRWRVNRRGRAKAGDVAGTLDDSRYLEVTVDRKKLLVHRVVFALANGYLPGQVDHINGLKTDNRPANLRAATNAQNNYNRGISAKSTSGVKGVSWHKKYGKWQAQCKAGGRRHYIGLFDDLAEADAATRAFREQHHGEFARHE